MDLSVVIPALNESANLSLLLPRIHEVLRRQGVTYEILVIDGGSRDDTIRQAESHGARAFVQSRPGYGGALLKGFEKSTGRYIVTMDADYSHDPYFILDLFRERSRGAIIVASRYVRGGYSEAGWFRSLLSVILNTLFRWILTVPVRDLSTGYRMYEGRVVRPLRITAQHFEALEEILIRIYGQGYAVHEIPFHYRARVKGVSNARILKIGWRLLVTMGRLWRLRNRFSWADYECRAFQSRFPLQRFWQRERYQADMGLLSRRDDILIVGAGSSRIVQGLPQAVSADAHLSKLRYLHHRGRRGAVAFPGALPFRDESFDQLVLSQVLEHERNPSLMIREARRLLRRGGSLIVGTPDSDRLSWKLLEWFYRMLVPAAVDHGHVAHLSYASLHRLLKAQGFTVEQVRYVAGSEVHLRARRD